MTATLTTPSIEERLDSLADQIAFLTAEAEAQRASRQRWHDLAEDAMPIVGAAMERVGGELEAVDLDTEAVVALTHRLAASVATLDRLLASMRSAVELADELSALGGPVLGEASAQLGELERKGYFRFARAGVGVVDEVVANFTEEDVQRLGENVVLMLNVAKDLTQPEILSVVRNMIEAVERQRLAIAAEPEAPPSLWQLARRVGDPEVRRGIGRALDTLRAVTAAEVTRETETPTPVAPVTDMRAGGS